MRQRTHLKASVLPTRKRPRKREAFKILDLRERLMPRLHPRTLRDVNGQLRLWRQRRGLRIR